MLRDSGEREDRAFEAAVRVFRHYHPGCPSVEAYGVVADWLERRDRGDASGEAR